MDIPAFLSIIQWTCVIVIVTAFLWFLFPHIGMPANWVAICRILLVILAFLAVVQTIYAYPERRIVSDPRIAPHPSTPLNPSIVR